MENRLYHEISSTNIILRVNVDLLSYTSSSYSSISVGLGTLLQWASLLAFEGMRPI